MKKKKITQVFERAVKFIYDKHKNNSNTNLIFCWIG